MATILGFTNNKLKFTRKMRKKEILFARVVKYDIIKHFAAFSSVLYIFR